MFFESSAKTGETAKNLFVQAAQELYRDVLKYKDSQPETEDSGNMKLPKGNRRDDLKTKKKPCC